MNHGQEGGYFFAFDVETVADVEAGRRLYGLEGLDDPSVAKAMHQLRLQESGREFLRLYLHRVVAVSGVLRRRSRSGDDDRIRIWSLGSPESGEKKLVETFFHIVETRAPTLVTWNGSGFDLPLLVYRALHHGVSAGRYFETGDPGFRFNNYLNRYHERHTDLMDVFAGRQSRAAAPLDELARFLGLPGKGRDAGRRTSRAGTSRGSSTRSAIIARWMRSSPGSSSFASIGSGAGSTMRSSPMSSPWCARRCGTGTTCGHSPTSASASASRAGILEASSFLALSQALCEASPGARASRPRGGRSRAGSTSARARGPHSQPCATCLVDPGRVRASPCLAPLIIASPSRRSRSWSRSGPWTTAGRGVAEVEGRRMRVPGALAGERVRVRYRRRRKRDDEAELVEVLAAAPSRVAPRCPHFYVCGGCDWQHLDPDAELRAKEAGVLAALAAVGVGPERVDPPHPRPPLRIPSQGPARRAVRAGKGGRARRLSREVRQPAGRARVVRGPASRGRAAAGRAALPRQLPGRARTHPPDRARCGRCRRDARVPPSRSARCGRPGASSPLRGRERARRRPPAGRAGFAGALRGRDRPLLPAERVRGRPPVPSPRLRPGERGGERGARRACGGGAPARGAGARPVRGDRQLHPCDRGAGGEGDRRRG